MALVISFIFLLLLPAHAQKEPPSTRWKAPLHNLTALQHEAAPQWVPEAQMRETFSILYSCTFTLFLCIYTAVHLNVPPPEHHVSFWLRKTKWVLVALLSPEVVLYSAWSQWKRARGFVAAMEGMRIKDLKGQQWGVSGNNHEPPRKRYTMLDGFFVVMGGFVVKVEDTELLDDLRRLEGRAATSYEPIHATYMTLTTTAVVELARLGLYLKVPRRTIKDKSKADVLAKGLVCCLVLWMMVQATARMAKGYPLTLLEIHTLVHVVCALCMYFLWFEKPLDIRDPTIVDGQVPEKLLSMFRGQLVRLSERDNKQVVLHRRRADVNIPGEAGPDPLLLERRAKNIYCHHKVLSLARDFGVMMTLSVLYGGVHMLAWRIGFPTQVEQLLWRVFCLLAIAGSPVAYLITDDATRSGTKGGMSAVVGLSFIFVVSRVLITIESFISIRKVPAGAYATVEWTQAIPHF